MPYFKNINLLLIHIPKTGGSSIEIYISNKFNISLTYNSIYSNLYLTYNKHSLQHCTYNELYNDKNNFGINFDNIKIITVVRNPYHRLISDLFYNKLINLDTTKDNIYEQVKYFLVSTEEKYDNHKLPQYLYLINNNGEIEKDIIIMKTETLNDDMKLNGFDDFDFNINVTHRNSINYLELLNNDSIKLINEYYIKDFELFGYEMLFCS
jgi:hypothetical protein